MAYKEFHQIKGMKECYFISEDGEIAKITKDAEREMKSHVSDRGYLRIKLIDVTGIRRAYPVHRLVAMMFVPNPDNKPEVNHKNGKKLDNHFENLEWCTRSENMLHSFAIGLSKPAKGLAERMRKLGARVGAENGRKGAKRKDDIHNQE